MRTAIELHFNDGSIIRAFERVSQRDTFTDPLGSFEFTVRPPRQLLDEYNQRLSKGEVCSLIVNGAPQAAMLIQTVRRTIGREGVTFDVTCESPLCTAFEGNADPDYAFSSKTDTDISGAVLDIMKPFGFSEVFVNADDDALVKLGKKVSRKGGTKFVISDLKHRDLQVQENDSAYAVCDRIISRLGLGLRCDAGGRLLLIRPNYDQDQAYTLVQTFANTVKGNRMLEPVTVEDTNKGQFSECVVRGVAHDSTSQTRTSRPIARVGNVSNRPDGAPYGKVSLTKLDEGLHGYSSSTAAPYKPKFYYDKKARDADRCTSVAKLILGLKAKDSFVVECEVDGWVSAEGRVWTIDTVARVVIEAIGLDDTLWVVERTLMLDRHSGERARLKLIPKNALVLGDVPS